MQSNFFSTNGVRLHNYHWQGTGKPLLLLAGLGANANVYSELAPKLANQFDGFALTRRRHGKSEKPASGYEMENLIQDIDHLSP